MPLYIEENSPISCATSCAPASWTRSSSPCRSRKPTYTTICRCTTSRSSPCCRPATLDQARESIDTELLNDKSLLLLGEGHCFRDQALEACPSLRRRRGRGANTHHGGIQLAGDHPPHGRPAWASRILPFPAVDSHHYAPGVIEVRPADAAGAVPHRRHRLARQLPAAQGHRSAGRLDPPVLGGPARPHEARRHDRAGPGPGHRAERGG